MKGFHNQQRGSSLIETLIASTLVSFVVVFVFHSHATILMHTSAEQVKAQAQFLARDLGAQLQPLAPHTLELVLPASFKTDTVLADVNCAALTPLDCEQAKNLTTQLTAWQQRFASQLSNARFELKRSDSETLMQVFWPKLENTSTQTALASWVITP